MCLCVCFFVFTFPLYIPTVKPIKVTSHIRKARGPQKQKKLAQDKKVREPLIYTNEIYLLQKDKKIFLLNKIMLC